MMNHKVSVITVCYNAEKTIEGTILSTLSQSYTNLEYIVIDGQSTDGTRNLFDKYKDRIHKILSERDEGTYDAMNKGIRISTGDILYFLNSDDRLYDKNVIQKVVEKFNQDDTVEMVRGKVQFINIPEQEQVIFQDHRFGELNDRKDVFTKLNYSHQGL